MVNKAPLTKFQLKPAQSSYTRDDHKARLELDRELLKVMIVK